MRITDFDTDVLVISITIALCALIFGLAFLISRYWTHILWCCARKTTEHAKIRYVHASDFTLYWNRIEGEVKGHIHSAGATLDDGRRIKVYMNHEDYIMLRANTEGMLTRKGGRFISFVPDGPAIPAAGE